MRWCILSEVHLPQEADTKKMTTKNYRICFLQKYNQANIILLIMIFLANLWSLKSDRCHASYVCISKENSLEILTNLMEKTRIIYFSNQNDEIHFLFLDAAQDTPNRHRLILNSDPNKYLFVTSIFSLSWGLAACFFMSSYGFRFKILNVKNIWIDLFWLTFNCYFSMKISGRWYIQVQYL